jgi:hypothetical protein
MVNKVRKWREVRNGEWSAVWWSEVKISGEMCGISFIAMQLFVGAVQCVFSSLFASLGYIIII